MSAPTLTRPAAPGGSPAPRGAAPAGPSLRARSDARRTLLVAAGAVLGMAPLMSVFSDYAWIAEFVAMVALIVGPAAVLRLQHRPTVLQLLPGAVLAVVFADLLYLRGGGLIPSGTTVELVRDLAGQAAQTVRTSTTPLLSTAALRMEVVPALTLTVFVIDWWAVVHRAPALAGIPLLAVFTTSGAIAGSVTWWQFVLAAAGYLVMLAADSRDVLLRWGRLVARRGETNRDGMSRVALGLSGRRIGIIAVIVAVLLPLAIPGLSRNLLSDALNGRGNGAGDGNGTGRSLSPLANLKGQLQRPEEINLFTVQVSGTDRAYYLRSKVLQRYTSRGWIEGDSPATQSVGSGVRNQTLGGDRSQYTARITVDELRDTGAPIFSLPTAVDGLSGWRFAPSTSTLTDARTRGGTTYTESVSEPAATTSQLTAATTRGAGLDPELSTAPADLPALVTQDVNQVTGTATSPYAKAFALLDWFRNSGGFTYSLSTEGGNSDSDLVNFLQTKVGYCQQYAAAMGVMLRVLGIPTRVVLGYTHNVLDSSGKVTVTNHDSHAWVEAWFDGIGWYPFDPTPLTGTDSNRQQNPQNVPTPGVSSAPSQPGGSDQTAPSASNSAPTSGPTGTTTVAAADTGSGSGRLPGWLLPTVLALLVVIVVLGWAPGVRVAARRRRFSKAARTGQVEPLWQELRASAGDTGAAWPAATTPGQVVSWLAERGAPRDGVSALARAVEQERYGVPGGASVGVAADRVRAAGRALRARLPWRRRVLSWLWPASVLRRRNRG